MEPYTVHYIKINAMGFQKKCSRAILARTPEEAALKMKKRWREGLKRYLLRVENPEGETMIKFFDYGTNHSI